MCNLLIVLLSFGYVSAAFIPDRGFRPSSRAIRLAPHPAAGPLNATSCRCTKGPSSAGRSTRTSQTKEEPSSENLVCAFFAVFCPAKGAWLVSKVAMDATMHASPGTLGTFMISFTWGAFFLWPRVSQTGRLARSRRRYRLPRGNPVLGLAHCVAGSTWRGCSSAFLPSTSSGLA